MEHRILRTNIHAKQRGNNSVYQSLNDCDVKND